MKFDFKMLYGVLIYCCIRKGEKSRGILKQKVYPDSMMYDKSNFNIFAIFYYSSHHINKKIHNRRKRRRMKSERSKKQAQQSIHTHTRMRKRVKGNKIR